MEGWDSVTAHLRDRMLLSVFVFVVFYISSGRDVLGYIEGRSDRDEWRRLVSLPGQELLLHGCNPVGVQQSATHPALPRGDQPVMSRPARHNGSPRPTSFDLQCHVLLSAMRRLGGGQPLLSVLPKGKVKKKKKKAYKMRDSRSQRKHWVEQGGYVIEHNLHEQLQHVVLLQTMLRKLAL